MKREIILSTLFGLSVWSSYGYTQEAPYAVRLQPLAPTQRYEVVAYEPRSVQPQANAVQYWPTNRQVVISNPDVDANARAEREQASRQLMMFSHGL